MNSYSRLEEEVVKANCHFHFVHFDDARVVYGWCCVVIRLPPGGTRFAGAALCQSPHRREEADLRRDGAGQAV